MKELYFTDCFKIAPVHGRVTYLPDGDTAYKVGLGTRAFYFCDDGYKLNGSKTNTCQKSGWREDTPTCEPKGMNYLHKNDYCVSFDTIYWH